MKYNGFSEFKPNLQTLVIPRATVKIPRKDANGEEVKENEVIVYDDYDPSMVFNAQAVENFDDFNKLVPEPAPTKIQKPGQGFRDDFTSPQYKKAQAEYLRKQSDWILIKSLAATKDLKWDTVDLENPETWSNWREELKEAHFSNNEINRLVQLVAKANGFDDSVYEEATQRFLAANR